jgi:cytochrome P450
MTDTVDGRLALDEVNFFDSDIQNCPYAAYDVLREEAPVWRDPRTGMFVVTRYDDIKMILLDTERFVNSRDRSKTNPMQDKIRQTYLDRGGWVPAPTLAGRDDPEHKEMRGLFNHAFRPSKIKAMDPFVEGLAHRLIDEFIDAGHCDWVRQFAVPLPLIVIGKQMGAKEEDIWQIKAWTDAWVQRLGMMQTEAEAIWSTEQEVEAQKYFQPIFERLRQEPDDSLLSDIVNTVVPEWGRTLTDEELHAEMMADTFVGGSETSTNALSAGVQLLIEHPEEWRKLKADPERYLPQLVEEVLRLEGPVQGLFRQVAVDTELHGVAIPAGAILNIRYAAANRDGDEFACPADMDLDRENVRTHLAFGFGTHHCLGAPLARRELYLGFKALVERIDEMWFSTNPDGTPQNDFAHQPNFCLRALEHLYIDFKPVTTM